MKDKNYFEHKYQRILIQSFAESMFKVTGWFYHYHEDEFQTELNLDPKYSYIFSSIDCYRTTVNALISQFENDIKDIHLEILKENNENEKKETEKKS